MLADDIAYAEDCRISGTITLADGERLSDALNRERETTIKYAELRSHADGHVVTLDQITLDRDDVFAIEAVGLRGPQDRRIHTVRHRLVLSLGPYTVLGQLHTLPGGQPLVAIGRRSPLIPLTNAEPEKSGGASANSPATPRDTAVRRSIRLTTRLRLQPHCAVPIGINARRDARRASACRRIGGGSAVDASRTSRRPKLADRWISRLTFATDGADDSVVPCQHAPGKAAAPRRAGEMQRRGPLRLRNSWGPTWGNGYEMLSALGLPAARLGSLAGHRGDRRAMKHGRSS